MPYEPMPHIIALAAAAGGIPIADATKPDGTIVIVMQDGRKLTFTPQPAQVKPPAAQAKADEPVKARRPAGKKKTK